MKRCTVFGVSETYLPFIVYVKKWIKNKTKDGKKLKKKQLEEQEEQEDPDCEPPAPKKKKKKDKLAVDQVNGHMDEATDMNGNSNGVETPKEKTKKKTEGETEVSAVWCLTSRIGILTKKGLVSDLKLITNYIHYP